MINICLPQQAQNTQTCGVFKYIPIGSMGSVYPWGMAGSCWVQQSPSDSWISGFQGIQLDFEVFILLGGEKCRRDGWISWKKQRWEETYVYILYMYVNIYIYIYTVCIYIFLKVHGMICCLLHLPKKQMKLLQLHRKKGANFQKGELLSGSPDLFVLPGGVITMVQDANCCCIVQLQPEKVQFWRNLHVALGWKWWGICIYWCWNVCKWIFTIHDWAIWQYIAEKVQVWNRKTMLNHDVTPW